MKEIQPDVTSVADVTSQEMTVEQLQTVLLNLKAEAAACTSAEQALLLTSRILAITARIKAAHGLSDKVPVPTLREHIQAMDPGYVFRPHLEYLITRLEAAVEKVENGESVWLRISMPPRMGKTDTTSIKFPTWLLRKHPGWHYGVMSHTGPLAASWGREIRRAVQAHPEWGVQLAKDAGAVTEWETVNKGKMLSKGVGEAIAGQGFKVLMADDVIGDAADAESPTIREKLWAKWSTDMLGRREPPTLYIVIGTRYHEDDLLGRLQDRMYERKPERWEIIEFPAIAEHGDVLGRNPGDPLYSPLLDETREEAIARWEETEEQVGPYAWSSLYMCSPTPADGDIFNGDWWRYWTTNPDHVTNDGRVRLFIPSEQMHGRWVDSWDMAYKGTETSDYVVGQRWCAVQANRFLIGQHRKRMDFVQSCEAMLKWAEPDSVGGTGHLVHERIVEDAANGPAIIQSLHDQIPGVIAIPPWGSKEARARAVTPECKSGNVYLPYPADPGNEWVPDLLHELNAFPRGKNDDAVDALTQAINRLRIGQGSVTVPGRVHREPVTRAIRQNGGIAMPSGRRVG